MIKNEKIALVTGSGRRLGRRIALGLAEGGYDLILHANRSAQGALKTVDEIKTKGGMAYLVTGDLSRVEDIRKMVEQTEAISDRLDLLVHNAGIFPTRSFEEVDEALWDATLNTNLRSIFFLTQGLLPLLKRAPGSSIVNLASLGGYQPWVNHIPYCVSKAGVVMLTRALAKQLAPGVRVNAIAPGIIVIPGEEEREHAPAGRIPLGRYGSAEDAVRTILFLAESASYITGQIVPLDGGTLAAS